MSLQGRLAVSATLTLLFFIAGCSSAPPSNQAAAAVTPQAQPAGAAAQAPEAFRHTVGRGETSTTVARKYLTQSVYMTVAEFDAALRQANNLASPKLSPGQQLVVPGLEPQPVVEKSRPVDPKQEIRAIYLTGTMAGSERGIQLIRKWKEAGGNAVVFDIKDSDGSLSIPFDHPLVPKRKSYSISNLGKFMRFLHSLEMHGIARIALFRDERIAQNVGRLAIQSRSTGQPWLENGKLAWADPSHPEVQEYNLALAKYVAHAGADEVQFDYVRFPAEGAQKDTKFVFQTTHPDWKRSDVITDFVRRAHAEIRQAGVPLSLDVFGVVAWQRSVDIAHTGQLIPELARHCDVLSPMIYPSHFFGMDGYAVPGDAPEHFIRTSMQRFVKITEGSGVVLRPWLQAFAWKTPSYSPEYIRVQVAASDANGGVGYLFWNARNDYGRPLTAMPVLMKMSAEKATRLAATASSESKPATKPAEPAKPGQPAAVTETTR